MDEFDDEACRSTRRDNHMTRVSYVIVAYRSQATIAALLDSIDTQEGNFEREVIVVDNSPNEDCADHFNNREVKYILNPQNSGYTRGMNQAIAAATGDRLLLLNPDVRLSADCTAKLLMAMSSDKMAAAAPQLLNDDGTIQASVRNFPKFSTLVYDAVGLSKLFPHSRIFGHWRNRYFDHKTTCAVQQPMASALMIKREIVDRLGPMDEQFFVFFSDVDYSKRIDDAGWETMFVAEAKAFHALGGSTRQEGTWLIWDSHRGFYRYLAKHELKGAKIALRPIAAAILGVGAVVRIIYRKLMGGSF